MPVPTVEPTPVLDQSLFAPTLGADQAGGGSGTPTPQDMNETILFVILPDHTTHSFTRNDITVMPARVVKHDNMEFQGVGLLDLLRSLELDPSGLHSITLAGKGSLTLLLSQVDEDTLLMLNGNGLLNALSPRRNRDEFPHDIVLITVN